MKILLFNRRYVKNPDAGGAEVFTHEVLKRLAERGHETTVFTASFGGSEDVDEIDGVEVVRSGGPFTVFRQAKKYYRRYFRGKFDVVIDEINDRPFMTPRYVEEPIVALIHQLTREFWFYETPFPLSWLGYFWLEERWLREYTNVPTLTVSESTEEDLSEVGFEDVTVVPQGITVDPLDTVPEKPDEPTLLFVGRMTKAKRPDHALEAFEYVAERRPDAQLRMVGDGYLQDDLRRKASAGVTFHGYVPETEKYDLMKRSHVLLVPSVREGWGLVVTEANAMGTPAVGYDVPGLRDSIEDGETGVLSDPRPEKMAEKALDLLEDGHRSRARAAVENARGHDWEKTATRIEEQCRERVDGTE